MSRYSKNNLVNAFKNRADSLNVDGLFAATTGISELSGKPVDLCVSYGQWATCKRFEQTLPTQPLPTKEQMIAQLDANAAKVAIMHGLSAKNGTAQLKGVLSDPAAMAAYGEMRLCLDLADAIHDGSFLRSWCKAS